MQCACRRCYIFFKHELNSMDIRTARAEDAGDMLEIYAPLVEGTAISFELCPPSIDEFTLRIEKYSKTHEWLIAENSERVLGYAYATPHRAREAYQFSVETSVYVKEGFRAEGIGKRLYTELFARLTQHNFHNAFAGIALPNDSSLALHKSVGFKQIGVFREIGYKHDMWHDVSWWQRRIDQ